MRGDANSMKVLRPATAEEAVALYADDTEARPLAGGTDFMVSWNAGELNGHTVIDLSRLSGWRRIRPTAVGLRLGALVTHAQLHSHATVRKHFPILAEACGTIGGSQIQTRGTIGGNIANASPAGDTFPPLLVYDTVVNLRSASGRRAVPLADVFVGVKETSLAEGELIESVDLVTPKRGVRHFFRKVGTRRASAISKVVAAGLLRLDREGRIRELRFALGSMAPTARRLSEVEAFVRGKRPSAKLAKEAALRLERDVSPIDDFRSTAEYRLHVARGLLRSFLLD